MMMMTMMEHCGTYSVADNVNLFQRHCRKWKKENPGALVVSRCLLRFVFCYNYWGNSMGEEIIKKKVEQ